MNVMAYVFLECEPKKIDAIVKHLRTMKTVQCACATMGPYDIVAYIEVDSMDALEAVVCHKIGGINGVRRTLTSLCVGCGCDDGPEKKPVKKAASKKR